MNGAQIKKYILKEEDLRYSNIWDDCESLRTELFNADQRKDCILIQGAAFVVQGRAFLMMGIGGIDFLDSLSQLDEVDGIIGNGNALFLSRDFKNVYSAHSNQELINCYEIEGYTAKVKFLYEAPLAPLIFLLRGFHSREDYDHTKIKIGNILFEEINTYAGEPIRFAGSLKSRLRGKFISTARVVHCASRPSFMNKESLFDSQEDIHKCLDNFRGRFALVYTMWDQKLCDVVGMSNTRKTANTYNPTDPITPHLVRISMSKF